MHMKAFARLFWQRRISPSRPCLVRPYRTWDLVPPTTRHVSGPPGLLGYTEAEDRAILYGRSQGLSYRTIALDIGRSEESVRHRYSKYLTSASPERRAWTPAEDALILERRARGVIWREIGAELKRSYMAVRLRYVRISLPKDQVSTKSTQSHSSSLSRGSVDPTDDLIVNAINQGKTYVAVGKEIGRSPEHVRVRYAKLAPEDWAARSTRRAEFTDEEREHILQLLTMGVKRSAIAAKLGRTTRQINWHISSHEKFKHAQFPRKWFTAAEIERMLELHGLGHNTEQIAQILGRRYVVVARKLNELLIHQPKPSLDRDWDAADTKAALELCSQGSTIRSIAMKLRRRYTSVKELLAEQSPNLPVKAPAQPRRWDEGEKRKLAELYQDRLGWDEIVKHFPGRSSVAVRSYFYQNLVDRSSRRSDVP